MSWSVKKLIIGKLDINWPFAIFVKKDCYPHFLIFCLIFCTKCLQYTRSQQIFCKKCTLNFCILGLLSLCTKHNSKVWHRIVLIIQKFWICFYPIFGNSYLVLVHPSLTKGSFCPTFVLRSIWNQPLDISILQTGKVQFTSP